MKIEKSIGLEIKTIDSLITRHIISNVKKSINIPLTPIQINIMGYLFKNNNEVYQRDLEHFLKLRRSTISGILKTMEKNGLIEKKCSKDDARINEIVLTKKSIDKTCEFHNKEISFDKFIKKGINEKDLDIFFKVTNQIKNNLMEENKNV